MDVLATLFVSFVLLFALAVILSGGNRLLAEEQYVVVEILLIKKTQSKESQVQCQLGDEKVNLQDLTVDSMLRSNKDDFQKCALYLGYMILNEVKKDLSSNGEKSESDVRSLRCFIFGKYLTPTNTEIRHVYFLSIYAPEQLTECLLSWAKIIIPTEQSPPNQPSQHCNLQAYEGGTSPTVKLFRCAERNCTNKKSWGEGQWLDPIKDNRLEQRFSAKDAPATIKAQSIRSACEGVDSNSRKYIFMINQLARGAYKLKITPGFFTEFKNYSVDLTVIHPYQTDSIKRTRNASEDTTWQNEEIKFTFNPAVD